MQIFAVFSVLISTCWTTITKGEMIPGAIRITEADAQTRREGVSYSNNVVHLNPYRPDQKAESTVQVNFNNQRQYKFNTSTHPIPKYTNSQFSHFPLVGLSSTRGSIPNSKDHVDSTLIAQASQHYPSLYTVPETQSFDVGYSVKFKNDPTRLISIRQPSIENEEIITGTRNEDVKRPHQEFDAEDYVSNALIDLKKQKVSGIKPKFHKFQSTKENDNKNFIMNLAPKTQRYLSFLGPPKPAIATFRQPKQTDNQNIQASWTNLSPSVEIYHSAEISHQIPKKHLDQLKEFDHEAALGKSQGFDYTNVLDVVSANPHQQMDFIQMPFDESFLKIARLPMGFPQLTNTVPQIDNENSMHVGVDPHNAAQHYASLNEVSYNNAPPFQSIPIMATQTLQKELSPPIEDILQEFSRPTGQGEASTLNSIQYADQIMPHNAKNIPLQTNVVTVPLDASMLAAMQQQAFQNEQSKLLQSQLEKLHLLSAQTDLKQDSQPVQDSQEQLIYQNKDFDKYFNYYIHTVKPQRNVEKSKHGIRTNRANNSKDVEMQTDLRPPPLSVANRRNIFV